MSFATQLRCEDEMVFDELFGFLDEVLALQEVFPIDDLFELISTAGVGDLVDKIFEHLGDWVGE